MNITRADAASWQWRRQPSDVADTEAAVAEVVQSVRQRKDEAVREYTSRFDGIAAATTADFSFEVPADARAAAWASLDIGLQQALQNAANRIRRFHELQRRDDLSYKGEDGEQLGLTWRPIERVGVYAPGGRAAYPSTVLMNVIPAQVAGVKDIVLVSPPQADTGWPHRLVLAAAHLLGVQRVFRVGGAQAVAALAFGTDEIPRVDKVVGPGNLYVALAKKLVMGEVGIDSIAGPSEVFIVADETANPAYVAADMLAQAEHDPEAGAVCVVTDRALVDPIAKALAAQLTTLPRREVAERALETWGAIVYAADLEEAVRLVNGCAPEHVELMVNHPERWLARISTAGAVFLGHYTPESVGDYYAGTNHVLPTFGTARFASGLGVDDFLRRMSYALYSPGSLHAHTIDITRLADAEGLTGHARAVTIRQTSERG